MQHCLHRFFFQTCPRLLHGHRLFPSASCDPSTRGVAIPASPLALDGERQIDERRQGALWRYDSAAGAGGVAARVDTTQFAIRDPRFGLYAPLLGYGTRRIRLVWMQLVRGAAVADCRHLRPHDAGGMEAELARDLGFHAGLLSLGQLCDSERKMHC